MERIIKDIEQLEFAGKLIDENSPTKSRLALFLIDNLAELIMHREIIFELIQYSLSSHYVFGKMAPDCPNKKEKIANLTYSFPNKVDFLVDDLKIINESDGNIFRAGHYVRNEAYHIGIIRDNIIGPLAKTYFHTICRIYPYFTKIIIGKAGNEFLRRYELKKFNIKKICLKISQGRECKVSELAKSISEHLQKRLQTTIDILGYMADPYLYMTEEGESKQIISEIRKLMPKLCPQSPDKILKWIQSKSNLKKRKNRYSGFKDTITFNI